MAVPLPDAAMIGLLRRLIAEPTAAVYTDADLSAILTRYPLRDGAGAWPDDVTWAGAWDTNQAAADVWEEKAAAAAADFDFSADGGQYSRSQVQAQSLAMTRRFRARRAAAAVPLVVYPPPAGSVHENGWIGNLPEED